MKCALTSLVVARLLRVTAAFGSTMACLAAWRYGISAGIGVAVGTAVAYLNLRSLVRAVEALADRIVEARSTERGGKLVWRFLGRYLLLLVVSYVIFRGSSRAFFGFLAGLCSPVGALMAEGVIGLASVFREP